MTNLPRYFDNTEIESIEVQYTQHVVNCDTNGDQFDIEVDKLEFESWMFGEGHWEEGSYDDATQAMKDEFYRDHFQFSLFIHLYIMESKRIEYGPFSQEYEIRKPRSKKAA